MYNKLTQVLKHNIDSYAIQEKQEVRAKCRKDLIYYKRPKNTKIKFRWDDFQKMIHDKRLKQQTDVILPSFEDLYWNY